MVRIRSVEDAFPRAGAVRFAQSPRPAFVAAAGSAAALLALALAAAGDVLPWPVAAWSGAFVALFLLLTLATLRRVLAPGGWLLACDGARVLLRTRSYLNRRPGDPDDVVEIPLVDIQAVREARLDVRGRDALNERHRRDATFLELELRPGIDLADVAERLRLERGHRTRGSTWRHYPVTIAGERTLRVEWRSRHARITPGIAEALRVLGEAVGAVRASPATQEALDLGGPGRAPAGEDPLGALRTLVVQGRILEATMLAQRAFGLSTTRAKALVERIAERAD